MKPQQTLDNVGFRSSNATYFKSGNRKGAVASQPPLVLVFGFNLSVLCTDGYTKGDRTPHTLQAKAFNYQYYGAIALIFYAWLIQLDYNEIGCA